jgi:hypothetical protein
MPSNNPKPFSHSCSLILLVSIFLLSASTVLAETKQLIPVKQNSPQKASANFPTRQLCADLSVSLKITKSSTGKLTLNGVVTNIGNADFTAAARTSFFMNVRHLPKTYNQTGVSEELCPVSFAPLKKGASRPVVCTYQIPDFKRWADHPSLRENTMRLFTLSVKAAGPSHFQADEECNQANNSKSVEIGYLR